MQCSRRRRRSRAFRLEKACYQGATNGAASGVRVCCSAATHCTGKASGSSPRCMRTVEGGQGRSVGQPAAGAQRAARICQPATPVHRRCAVRPAGGRGTPTSPQSCQTGRAAGSAPVGLQRRSGAGAVRRWCGVQKHVSSVAHREAAGGCRASPTTHGQPSRGRTHLPACPPNRPAGRQAPLTLYPQRGGGVGGGGGGGGASWGGGGAAHAQHLHAHRHAIPLGLHLRIALGAHGGGEADQAARVHLVHVVRAKVGDELVEQGLRARRGGGRG